MKKAWVFALVREDLIKQVIDDLKSIDEVEEMYRTKGEDFNLMILVRAQDKDRVAQVIMQVIRNEPGLIRTSTFYTERC